MQARCATIVSARTVLESLDHFQQAGNVADLVFAPSVDIFLNQQGAFDVHHVYIGVYTTSMYVIIVSPLSC